jgi:putative hydrolase of the HAD superfamily
MSEEIDAIFFDVGGTLVDLRPTKEEVFRRHLKAHGLDVSIEMLAPILAKAERRFDAQTAELNGKNEEAFWEQYDNFVLDAIGYSGERKSFSKDLSDDFGILIPEVANWVEFPDARPLLDDLRDRDFKLGVISNATDLARKVLVNLRLDRYFKALVISAEVGVNKPDQKIFQIAAKELKVSPGRAIYIGDRLAVDVIGARRAGMNAILVDRSGAYQDVNCLRVKSLSSLRRYL